MNLFLHWPEGNQNKYTISGILGAAGTKRQRKRTFVAQEVVELLNRPTEQYYVF